MPRGIAVLLAVTGIYGVMSYFVNEPPRESGIRVALRAQSAVAPRFPAS
jgi:hypothetical protein